MNRHTDWAAGLAPFCRTYNRERHIPAWAPGGATLEAQPTRNIATAATTNSSAGAAVRGNSCTIRLISTDG